MKRAFIIIMLILCCTLSTTADTNQLSLSEALAIAEGQFEGKDVDYYVLQEDNASVWRIFVDAEPTKGWEHDCYLLTIPKTTNSGILASRTQLRMPPSGKTDQEGCVTTESISLEENFGIESIALTADGGTLTVNLHNNAPANASISIVSLLDGTQKTTQNIPGTTSSITVDTSNLHNGAYAVVHSAQGELIDQKKFNK